MKKSVLKVLIVSLCMSAFIGIFVILTGSWGELEGKILGTTSIVFAFSISGLCCSTIYDIKKYKRFSVFGVICCLLACLWSMLIIWGSINLFDGSFIWKSLATLILISYSSAHISLMLIIKNQNTMVKNIKNITISLAVLMDIMILALTWNIVPSFGKLMWVFSILITLGTIVSPILNKVYKNVPNTSKNSN